jgi:hypothetical protein
MSPRRPASRRRYCGFTPRRGCERLRDKDGPSSGHPDRAPSKCKRRRWAPTRRRGGRDGERARERDLQHDRRPRVHGVVRQFLLEPADMCAWNFGTTYTTTNGARAKRAPRQPRLPAASNSGCRTPVASARSTRAARRRR